VNVLFAAFDSLEGSLWIGIRNDRLAIHIAGSLTVYKHVSPGAWRFAIKLRRSRAGLPYTCHLGLRGKKRTQRKREEKD